MNTPALVFSGRGIFLINYFKFMLNLNKLAKGAYLRQTKYFTKIKLNILVLIKESNYL